MILLLLRCLELNVYLEDRTISMKSRAILENTITLATTYLDLGESHHDRLASRHPSSAGWTS